MGIVCELYRASDSLIAQIAANPQEAEAFVTENFASVYGSLHNDNTVSSMDKAWAIAFFMLKEADTSPGKVLSGWRGKRFDENDYDSPYYLTSEQVKSMSAALSQLTMEDVKAAYNLEKMEAEDVYRAGWHTLEQWSYIKAHIDAIINTFKNAAEAGEGIIINYS